MFATGGRLRKVRVGKSTYGRGVFAQRSFHDAEVVGEVRGRVIDDEHYGSNYGIDLGGTLTLEPQSPFRYLNHSCRPNCQLFQYEDSPFDPALSERMFLQAVRPILAGEELTIDYAWPAESAIPCGCRSDECRGFIVDADDLHRVPQFWPQAG